MTDQQLKRKRMNTRTKIREYINKGKDITNLQAEYDNILDEMKSRGLTVYTKDSTEYLRKFQRKHKIIVNQKLESLRNAPIPIIKPYNLKFIYNEFTSDNIKDNMDNYFDLVGLKKTGEDFEDSNNKTIYIKNYEYDGSEECFNIIKKSSNIILNILNTNNDTDLEVYSKK